jgi:hypothetical protein
MDPRGSTDWRHLVTARRIAGDIPHHSAKE